MIALIKTVLMNICDIKAFSKLQLDNIIIEVILVE